MRRAARIEIFFGLFALALIYLVLAKDASITGFITSPSYEILLVSPPHDLQTTQTSMAFMFKYPYNLEITECSLILNDELARTANALLSPRDTRIRVDLVEGSYLWRIECLDASTNTRLISNTRRLRIGEQVEPELKISKFPGRDGYLYSFELREGLELEINEVLPNDVLRAVKDENEYDINILRIFQDYSTGIENVELMNTPGDKRIRLETGKSIPLDLNNDWEDDMILALTDISYRKAFFKVSVPAPKEEVVPEEEPRDTGIEAPTIIIKPLEMEEEEKEPAEISEKEGAFGIVQLFVIGLVIVVIIALITTPRDKKEKDERSYISALKERVKFIKPKKKPAKKKRRKKK